MRQVAAKLRLDLAQYRELAAFAQFGSELDKTTQMQLTRGEKMVEILKQAQFVPLPMAKQILIIYCGTRGLLDDLPINLMKDFEIKFLQHIEKEYPDVEYEIENKKELSPELMKKLDEIIFSFRQYFKGTSAS